MAENNDKWTCTILGWHTYEELETILFDSILSEQEQEDNSDCDVPSKIPLKIHRVSRIENQCQGMQQPATGNWQKGSALQRAGLGASTVPTKERGYSM